MRINLIAQGFEFQFPFAGLIFLPLAGHFFQLKYQGVQGASKKTDFVRALVVNGFVQVFI